MKNEETLFIVFLLVISLVLIVLSFEFSPGSMTLPLLSGIGASALAVFLILMMLSSNIAGWYQKFESKPVFSALVVKSTERKKEGLIVAWFSGCTAGIYFFGFMAGIPLFLFLFLKVWGKESWLLSVVVSAVVLGVVYFTFIYVLRVPLHRGIFLE